MSTPALPPTIDTDPRMADAEPARVVGAEPAGATSEDGSLVTEYGLLAVVGATIAAAVIQWASDGALSTLFNALLRQARDIVGA